uniref:Serine/threonine-protein kinase PLK n=1 Tax=Ditylenchus dipsaci TaxID=166011 RepID=A0A915DM13_9BILA
MSARQAKPVKAPLKEVPDVVIDSGAKRTFTKGRFLGKGGFARCYELIENGSKTVYAGKVVSKTLLVKKHQRDKMTQEVSIHRSLSHPHVVKLEGCFEDSENVYVLLELCARRSLMELHKRRRAVSEPEARYFTHQIVLACEYLHDNNIIHRDLKLGNLFLNDEMQVKIGDFGLATTVEYEGERKRTLCGTPNYIAPEMLDKKGHSYEVDIWAIGCILYTLLVGKPPFETETLKDTYNRIKCNQYVIPPRIGKDAASLIGRLLAPDPTRRPRALSGGHGDVLRENQMGVRSPAYTRTLPTVPESQVVKSVKQDAASVLVTEKAPDDHNMPSDFFLSDLYSQLSSLFNSNPDRFKESDKVTLRILPALPSIGSPNGWTTLTKYGLGYQLSDNSVGVLFNDTTKIVLDAAGDQIQYTERNGAERYYVVNHYPAALEKKVTLLRYFRSYMNEHLIKTGANIPKREGDELARLPCLNTWFRTKSAIVLHMSNGTLQVNFFHDHSKLIVFQSAGKDWLPEGSLVSLKIHESHGERLMSRSKSSVPGSLSTVNALGQNARSQSGGPN